MKKIILSLAAFMLFCSHDMFLKLDTYHLSPNAPAEIELYNGTFEKSDNTIARSRMNDVSLVGNGERVQVDTIQWTEEGDVTVLKFVSGDAGTWVAGVSTNPRNIEMTAEDFNDYLEHDGVLDMLEWRKQNNTLGEDAIEKYSKHVKTIFQVGDKKTEDWQTILGYPIEFVPLSNPYDLEVGDDFKVRLMRNGQALPNQIVYAGSDAHSHDDEHSHEDHDDEDHHHDATLLRTNDDGVVTMEIANEGQQYLRSIHLEHSEEEGLTHESNWATLTFTVGQAHSQSDHSHSHDDHDHSHGDHDHSHGLPSFVYWIGGLLLLVVLFYLFRRNR
ncbi:MAG: DUF4198 domain-containing protein [Bacteroidia bacterium]|nr:DUF4198 domain-containing protein [Bacteroidia bacterium]